MGKIKVPVDDGSGDEPIVDRLMDRVSRLHGDVKQQGADLKGLTRTVGALSEAMAELVGGDQDDDAGGARPLGWWQPIDPAAAQKSLTELAQWLDTVWAQWKDGDDALTPCWPWHWAAVIELWAAYRAWVWCDKPDRVMYRADWLDRIRPRTVERLRDVLRSCTPQQHTPDQRGDIPADRRSGKARTAVPALSDLAAAYANGAALPYPSPEIIQAGRETYGGAWR